MSQAKAITGKFYPLQYQEWLKACQELTPAAKDVLYLIRTLDPYSDGVEISATEIAKQLSTEKRTVHRSTVSRAFKELDAKGFINLEILKAYITVKAKGVHCCDKTSCCDDATTVCDNNERCDDTTAAIATQQQHNIDHARALKTNSDLDQTSKYLNTKESTHKKIELEPEVIKESAGVAGDKPVPARVSGKKNSSQNTRYDSSSSLQDPLQTSRQQDDLSLDKGSDALEGVITNERFGVEEFLPKLSQKSRSPTTKKFDCELLRSLYNEYKPPLWASCRCLNSNRINALKKVYEDCGESAPQMLKDALLFVTSEEWWSAKVLSLDNLLTKGKVVELAEKWQAKCASPDARQGDSHVTQNPASQTWGEWVREAEKRRLVEFSQSAGNDIMVHLRSGTSRLWSELRSLSWDAIAMEVDQGEASPWHTSNLTNS